MFLQRSSEVRLRSHSSGRMGSSLPLRVCRLEEVSSPCLRLCFLSGGALLATFVLSPPRSSARPQWLETEIRSGEAPLQRHTSFRGCALLIRSVTNPARLGRDKLLSP